MNFLEGQPVAQPIRVDRRLIVEDQGSGKLIYPEYEPGYMLNSKPKGIDYACVVRRSNARLSVHSLPFEALGAVETTYIGDTPQATRHYWVGTNARLIQSEQTPQIVKVQAANGKIYDAGDNAEIVPELHRYEYWTEVKDYDLVRSIYPVSL